MPSTRSTRIPFAPQTARAAALAVLVRVSSESAFANVALRATLRTRQLDRRSRAQATAFVYGTLRWRRRLDWYLQQVSDRSLASLDPWVLEALRLFAFQVEWMDAVPNEVAAHEAVELVKACGPRAAAASGFVNAVCRAYLQRRPRLSLPDPACDPVKSLAINGSQPSWLVQRWVDRWGVPEARAWVAAMNTPAPVTLRAVRTDPHGLVGELVRSGVRARVGDWSPHAVVVASGDVSRLQAFNDGRCIVQGEASQLVALAVEPRAGEHVLDMCSAPGGKATHLAELMEDRGCVVSVDVHRGRVRLIDQAVRRLHLRSVRTIATDARRLPSLGRTYDRVLLDAPCSGTGVLRRRPDLRWRLRPGDLAGLVTLQRELLAAAAALVRPGGVLVYSTCSMEAEECEANRAWFLDSQPAFTPQSLGVALPARLVRTLRMQGARPEEGHVRLMPNRHRTDGFYIARFVRKSSNPERTAGIGNTSRNVCSSSVGKV